MYFLKQKDQILMIEHRKLILKFFSTSQPPLQRLRLTWVLRCFSSRSNSEILCRNTSSGLSSPPLDWTTWSDSSRSFSSRFMASSFVILVSSSVGLLRISSSPLLLLASLSFRSRISCFRDCSFCSSNSIFDFPSSPLLLWIKKF